MRDDRPGAPRPISIWSPVGQGNALRWVRPELGPLGDHYAARRELRPRRPPGPGRSGGPRRVAFFGESAAAGYLYAPHATPAQVLEEQLCALAGEGRFEVLDLARTNETLAGLATTIEASLQLDPDALVIFAGNNWNLLETPRWSPFAPAAGDRRRFAEALAESLTGPRERARRELVERAWTFFLRLAELTRERAFTAGRALQVVWVVPEVNLADWANRQPVAWLPGDGSARWYAAYSRARRALAAGAFDEAVAAGWEMVDLDGETCPSSCRVLAQGYLGQGALDEARAAAIAEVDAASYSLSPWLGAPQATTTARQLCLRAGRDFGFGVADLRPLYAEAAAGALPGRRFFLDYCHLTLEGMHLAMAGVTARLLAEEMPGLTWQSVAREVPAPVVPPAADAAAKLGAAVHSAHRLLPLSPKAELLESWCRDALAADPGIAQAMLEVIEARTAPVPAMLSPAQASNLASSHRLSLQHGWRWDCLDADLLAAVGSALDESEPTAAERARSLVARCSLGAPPRDLSRAPCLWEPLERFWCELADFADLPRHAAYRATWPESTFALVASGRTAVTLEATLRLPAIPGVDVERRGTVELAIKGEVVATFAVGPAWSVARCSLSPTLLRPGLNRVTLRWPGLPPVGTEALAGARARLEKGLPAEIHPVFGEVFSLLVHE